MRMYIIFLALIGAVYGDTSKWLDFRVKYSPVATGIDVDSFWSIPKTVSEALLVEWSQAETSNSLGATTMCYKTDHRVCGLYDKRGTIAGLQLSIHFDDIESQNVPYNFNRFPIYEKKAINGVEHWTCTYYLVDPQIVANEGRPNNSSRIGEGLWLKSGNDFTQIPTDVESIKNSTLYTWQNCITNMGIHYYYNMTPSFTCEDIQPFALIVKEGNLIGLSWQVTGRATPVLRNYYEAINSQAVQATVPLAPPCLYSNADVYGAISIHSYFIERPWTIVCDQQTESVVPLG